LVFSEGNVINKKGIRMKRLIIIISLLLLSFPTGVFGASVTQGSVVDLGEERLNSNPTRTLEFVCVGNPDNETMTVRNFEKVKGWCLTWIEVFPTGTAPDAPDAASIFILDADGMDLLGSEDGSTTPYAGLNIIHATLKRACYPNLLLSRAGLHINYFPPVNSLLTLKVIDQGDATGEYTVRLTFERRK
jgi:hypothetical protein